MLGLPSHGRPAGFAALASRPPVIQGSSWARRLTLVTPPILAKPPVKPLNLLATHTTKALINAMAHLSCPLSHAPHHTSKRDAARPLEGRAKCQVSDDRRRSKMGRGR